MQYKITNDYSLFKVIDANRDINDKHVKNLSDSIRNDGLLVPIWITPEFEIIDGQHRFEACKKLGLPVKYEVKEKLNMQQLVAINSTSRIWRNNDYVKAFVNAGNEHYIKLKTFCDANSDFGLPACILMLSSLKQIASTSTDAQFISESNPDGKYSTKSHFSQGKFFVNDFNRAEHYASLIRGVKPFYKKYNRIFFLRAMISLINYDKFSYSLFMTKLKLNPTGIKDAVNVTQYLQMIQDVYNYRNNDPQLFTHLAKKRKK